MLLWVGRVDGLRVEFDVDLVYDGLEETSSIEGLRAQLAEGF